MIKALTAAATGLEAQQANIERISNDLANVNTDGYKRSRTEFQDLMYETVKQAGGSLGDDIYTGYYPDTRRHAEQFVDSVFDDYLEGQ
jgi:flagellar basal body rod protein FlgG